MRRKRLLGCSSRGLCFGVLVPGTLVSSDVLLVLFEAPKSLGLSKSSSNNYTNVSFWKSSSLVFEHKTLSRK